MSRHIPASSPGVLPADVGFVPISGVKFSWLLWVSELRHGINNTRGALIEVLRSLWFWPKGSMLSEVFQR